VRILFVLLLAALAAPAQLHAEDIVAEALKSFPPETVRLEYSNSAKLRSFAGLRAPSPALPCPADQEAGKVSGTAQHPGADVDEVVLGWKSGSSGLDLLRPRHGALQREGDF